jgi:hypothetical protein
VLDTKGKPKKGSKTCDASYLSKVDITRVNTEEEIELTKYRQKFNALRSELQRK